MPSLNWFTASKCDNVVFYINAIEYDSAFKNLISFHRKLSVELRANTNVILVSSIRENIFQKYNQTNEYSSILMPIKIDSPMNSEEAG